VKGIHGMEQQEKIQKMKDGDITIKQSGKAI
jgi:hypothetical protein